MATILNRNISKDKRLVLKYVLQREPTVGVSRRKLFRNLLLWLFVKTKPFMPGYPHSKVLSKLFVYLGIKVAPRKRFISSLCIA